jgi:phage repressor protein C with HTH and peptisase S24 domain
MRPPVVLARVSGPSMVPTLRSGDLVIARNRAGTVTPGVVVLARYRSMPDRLVVKRAVRAVGADWWLASDNPFAGGGSDQHGAAELVGRVYLRLRVARSPIGIVRAIPADG